MTTLPDRPRCPVVVVAHGLGSRLASVATGIHKTSEIVHGRPLLWWLLTDILGAGLTGPTIVTVRGDDPVLSAVVDGFGTRVQTQVLQPAGYLRDVYVLSRRYGPRFTVIEADTITYPGTLRNFLRLAEDLGHAYDLCVGVAPTAANPNGPAVVLTHDGEVHAMSWNTTPTGAVPLAAWHWTSRLLDHAEEFSTHSSSIAEYVTAERRHRAARIRPIGITAGFNINTPVDLQRARDGVARWYDATPYATPTQPAT